MSSMNVQLFSKSVLDQFALLVSAQEKYAEGNDQGALEEFKVASSQLPTALIENIYYKVWDLADRPKGNPNFGKEVIYNLISHDSSDGLIKAEAINTSIVEYFLEVIPRFVQEMRKSTECPILHEPMKNPVVIFSGHSFERAAIEEQQVCLLRKGMRQLECPVTKKTDFSPLTPNFLARSLIELVQDSASQLSVIPVVMRRIFEENQRLQAENKELKSKSLRIDPARYEQLNQQLFSLNGQFMALQMTSSTQIQTLTTENHHLADRNHHLAGENHHLAEQNRYLAEQNYQLTERNRLLTDENRIHQERSTSLLREREETLRDADRLADRLRLEQEARLAQERRERDRQSVIQIQTIYIASMERQRSSRPPTQTPPSSAPISQPIFGKAGCDSPFDFILKAVQSIFGN